jgi:hypothetical protein
VHESIILAAKMRDYIVCRYSAIIDGAAGGRHLAVWSRWDVHFLNLTSRLCERRNFNSISMLAEQFEQGVNHRYRYTIYVGMYVYLWGKGSRLY